MENIDKSNMFSFGRILNDLIEEIKDNKVTNKELLDRLIKEVRTINQKQDLMLNRVNENSKRIEEVEKRAVEDKIYLEDCLNIIKPEHKKIAIDNRMLKIEQQAAINKRVGEKIEEIEKEALGRKEELERLAEIERKKTINFLKRADSKSKNLVYQQVYSRRTKGESFADIAHSLNMTNREVRLAFGRAKSHKNQ